MNLFCLKNNYIQFKVHKISRKFVKDCREIGKERLKKRRIRWNEHIWNQRETKKGRKKREKEKETEWKN